MSVLAAWLPLAAAYSFSAPGAHMRALGHPVVQGRTVANVAMEIKTASIAMPALSSTMTEGKISEWLVGVGDKVSSGDMVLVVESDKADMDVETYEEGFIAKILVGEGEVAPVGAPVAILCEKAEDIDAAAAQGAGGAPAAAAEPAAAAPAAAAPAAVSPPPLLPIVSPSPCCPSRSSPAELVLPPPAWCDGAGGERRGDGADLHARPLIDDDRG